MEKKGIHIILLSKAIPLPSDPLKHNKQGRNVWNQWSIADKLKYAFAIALLKRKNLPVN